MDWKDIAGPLTSAGATTLGTIIGGPLGTAVGGLVGQAVGQALGLDKPTPEAVKAAIDADPAAASTKLQDLEDQRSSEWAALEAKGLELMASIQAQEGSEGFFSWGWRPALSWLIAAIILQSFILGPWLLAFAGRSVGVPYDQVLGISAIWLTIYGGGHTIKSIFGTRLG